MESSTHQRLLALDIFRGMTIFFMIVVNTPGSWSHVYAPLLHAKWDGCTPTDLVFPFFLFIVGVSMAFSFRKFSLEKRGEWISKVIKRTALIFAIGIALNWFPFFDQHISELRIFGVLQRIALGYGCAALIVIFFKEKHIPMLSIFILLAYWLLLLFAGGEDPLSLQDNLVRKIDLALLGENHIYGGYGIPFDPEGILSTLPSIVTALAGYLVGKLILSNQSLKTRITKMVIGGLALIGIAVSWHYLGCPINKPIWSSSYVLFTAGLAMCFLGLLLTITDLWGQHKWAFPFKVFGLNPLISYILSSIVSTMTGVILIGGKSLTSWLYGTIYQPWFGYKLGSLIFALDVVALVFIFAYLLYRNGKVVKV